MVNKTMTSITIPSTVKEIGTWDFAGCTKLSSVVFTEGIQKISGKAFSSCDSLKSIIFPSSLTYLDFWDIQTIGSISDSGCNFNLTLTFLGDVSTINFRSFTV